MTNKITKCAYEDCGAGATTPAKGRAHKHRFIAMYCDVHAPIVADEGAPEYNAVCPHCGCEFWIN